MQILDRLTVRIEVVIDDRRDRGVPEQAHGAESALAVADEEIVLFVDVPPDSDCLQQAVCLDGFGQLNDRGFVERLTNVVRIALDPGDR